MCCFFCCKQKTAYEMRISDWSSDVCSSDLCFCLCRGRRGRGCRGPAAAPGRRTVCVAWGSLSLLVARDLFSSCVLYAPASRFVPGCCAPRAGLTGAGTRSEERRVGKSVSVRVDIGGRRIIKNKTKKKTSESIK